MITVVPKSINATEVFNFIEDQVKEWIKEPLVIEGKKYRAFLGLVIKY